MSQPAVETVSIAQAQYPLFLGVDVGGTNIKLGIVDDLGRTLIRREVKTDEQFGPEDAMKRVAAAGDQMAGQLGLALADLAAVGLATPGTMDTKRGMLLQPHNLPNWWNFPIRDCLARICGRPIAFANDANAAAFGEYWVGSGRAFASIAFFTLGTGVGGGIIVAGKMIDGEHSAGSECGHMIIDYHASARLCGCGGYGHLEAYASGKAVVERAREALAARPDSSLQDRLRQGEDLTPLMVSQEAERGDALAMDIVMETALYLAVGAVNVMHIIDPDAVIFGGAMTFGGPQSPLGRQFLDRIRQEARSRVFPFLARQTAIEFASLGSDAGYIGAAGIAREQLQKSPACAGSSG